MKVVIDTNVLIAAFGKTSPYRKIFDFFLDAKFTVLLSNEVLLEYFEVMSKKSSVQVAENLVMVFLSAENIELHDIFYKWLLGENDRDDNKFSDLSVTGNADYLITNDAHFNVLKLQQFPPVNIISADGFINLLKEM